MEKEEEAVVTQDSSDLFLNVSISGEAVAVTPTNAVAKLSCVDEQLDLRL